MKKFYTYMEAYEWCREFASADCSVLVVGFWINFEWKRPISPYDLMVADLNGIRR